MKGSLYLVPVTLGTKEYSHVLPAGVLSIIATLRFFIVEDIRSARRFLRLIDKNFPIDDCEFFVLNEHTATGEMESFLEPILNGNDAAIMSEAGVPCVADPGSLLVKYAHTHSVKVVPLTGPSSIILALMASGFNGQNFTFNGYIPVKSSDRIRSIKEIEKKAREGHSQIMIEAPYRNISLLEDILRTCKPDTNLSIAANLTTDEEYIKTASIKQWKGKLPSINKIPAIFILG